MIELEQVDNDLWSDESGTHVIVEDAGQFLVRDEGGTIGTFDTLADAVRCADGSWDGATLAATSRLRHDIETGRVDEIGTSLLEYLAGHGTAGIDAQELARRVFERQL